MALFGQSPLGVGGIFADGPCIHPASPCTALTFFSATASRNSAGEILTSYASIGTITGLLEPRQGGYIRQRHGLEAQVLYTFYVMGTTALRQGNRVTIGADRLEIVSVQPWGTTYTEIDLADIGR